MTKNRQTISLRIDANLEYEIAFIKKALDMNLSLVIKDAIHSKFLQIKAETVKKTPGEILQSSGFIGSFEGSADLSSNYKKEALKLILKKHGIKKT